MTSLQRGDSMSGLLGTMEGLVQAEASIPESPANEPDSAADGDPLLESSSAEELQLYSIPSIDPQLPRITPLSSIGERLYLDRRCALAVRAGCLYQPCSS